MILRHRSFAALTVFLVVAATTTALWLLVRHP